MDKPIPITPSLLERFWPKVDKNGPIPDYAPHLGPCWVWTSKSKNLGGYGIIWAGSKTDGSRKIYLAHRVSYVIHKGEIPPKYRVDHLCRVRHCVNPAHLEAVTHRENVIRGTVIEVNKARGAAQTKCRYGHEYTPENTYTDPRGRRRCRTCRRYDRNDRRHRPLAMARIYTPTGRQDVTMTHYAVDAGVLNVRLRDELVASFAPGQWLAIVKERKGIPAPEAFAQIRAINKPLKSGVQPAKSGTGRGRSNGPPVDTAQLVLAGL